MVGYGSGSSSGQAVWGTWRGSPLRTLFQGALAIPFPACKKIRKGNKKARKIKRGMCVGGC